MQSIGVCEKGGYSVVMVETVGVGQSEVGIEELVDVMVLVLPPASGDSFQAIKKGIVESADIIVINKADGELLPVANRSAFEYASSMRLKGTGLGGGREEERKKVVCVSSRTGYNISHLHSLLSSFLLSSSPFLGEKRAAQAKKAVWEIAKEDFYTLLLHKHSSLSPLVQQIFSFASHNQLPPSMAASLLLRLFSSSNSF